VTQEKDHKAASEGPGNHAPQTVVGVPRMPSSRAPRLGGPPPRPSSRPPADPAPALERFFAPAPAPPRREREVKRVAPVPREKLPSLEEISSSLLLNDDPSSTSALPRFEELSGSLLLEDPTEVKEFPVAAPAAAPVNRTVMAAQSADRAVPVPAPYERPAPAAHQALLGMPELPTSTPGPSLENGAAQLPPIRATLRPPVAPDTSPNPDPYPSSEITAADATDAVPPPPEHMYEALQGYEAAARVDAPAPPDDDGTATSTYEAAIVQQPSAQPSVPVQGDVEVTSLPRGWLDGASSSVKRMLSSLTAPAGAGGVGQEGRKRWFLPVIALAGLGVGIGAVALVVSLTRKTDESEAPAPPSASTVAASSEGSQPAPSASVVAAAPVAATAAAPAATEAAASTSPCKVAGKPRVVAPSAIVPAGIEVRSIGNDVALGFAPNEHQATAVRIDASSLATSSTTDAQSSEAVRRVVPLASSDGALTIATDVDREGDALQGRRTVPLDPPLEIGAAGGDLVWARSGGGAGGKLWPIEGGGNVEALRGATDLDSAGSVAIALRHAGAIWMGAAEGHDTLAPRGALSRATGSGTAVGSPAVAMNDGVVVVAWADRASQDDPWRLRWVRFKAGEVPGEPGTFTPPAGGRGEQAMSPGLAAVPGGRFLLVWTEGPATRHDVRALTLSRDGEPIGKPLDISRKSVNAGQGQVAVNSARQGLVAYLESSGDGFQVVATPISCGP
jgi:hypothetical protein